MVKALAPKLLEIPLFLGVHLKRQAFDVATVCSFGSEDDAWQGLVVCKCGHEGDGRVPLWLMMSKAYERKLQKKERMPYAIGKDGSLIFLHPLNLIVEFNWM